MPHALDVLSNIVFVIVGGIGCLYVLRNPKEISYFKAWLVFFLAVFFVGPGSAYYHFSPTNETLIWDRLPMSVAFVALYISLLSEAITSKIEKFLPLGVLLGILSIIYWVLTDDLRFYFWLQFSLLLTMPLILLMFKNIRGKRFYFFTFIFYALAKIFEVKDLEIYKMTNNFVSGHNLKHILSGIAIYFLYLLLKSYKKTREDKNHA